MECDNCQNNNGLEDAFRAIKTIIFVYNNSYDIHVHVFYCNVWLSNDFTSARINGRLDETITEIHVWQQDTLKHKTQYIQVIQQDNHINIFVPEYTVTMKPVWSATFQTLDTNSTFTLHKKHTRVGWKFHRLTKKELCHSNECASILVYSPEVLHSTGRKRRNLTCIKFNLSWYYLHCFLPDKPTLDK